jgi:sigma-B regulation protein RsbU (phosphoserine phosphatase)
LLYTAGLIEARRGDPAFDEGALAAYSADRAHLDAVDLTHDLATLIPKLKPSDDVALLVISAC